jgi:hypothetical protein
VPNGGGRGARPRIRIRHAAGKLRLAIAAAGEWIQAASAAPSPTHPHRPPRLTLVKWPGCDEPLIIIELRPAQLEAIAAGFRRWSPSEVDAPFHRRAIVERTAAGAAVLVNGVLVASGGIDNDEASWQQLESCLIAAVELGQLSGNQVTLAEDFADLAEAGGVWMAELPMADLGPNWSHLRQASK